MNVENISLGEAATRFLASLPEEDRAIHQQEINQFILWYGWKQPISDLTAPKVANYAERIATSGADPARKLTPVKAFLTYAKKEGFTRTNLSVHLRAKKISTTVAAGKPMPTVHALTPQGRADLEAEFSRLKAERPRVAEELRKAAADKDFRENAPLDAAREYQGQLEARIRELETIIKAVPVELVQPAAAKVRIGDRVRLFDISVSQVVCYTLVSPSEASPAKGKISIESPTGKALLGKEEGQEAEVIAPLGKFCYRIEKIER
ncbi:MAG TPA: transcription elongation factor GreA [Dehalococcoidia bacterium]|nr:transcription elongation factor GreA [Dehalococcoidia bacterium]